MNNNLGVVDNLRWIFFLGFWGIVLGVRIMREISCVHSSLPRDRPADEGSRRAAKKQLIEHSGQGHEAHDHKARYALIGMICLRHWAGQRPGPAGDRELRDLGPCRSSDVDEAGCQCSVQRRGRIPDGK